MRVENKSSKFASEFDAHSEFFDNALSYIDKPELLESVEVRLINNVPSKVTNNIPKREKKSKDDDFYPATEVLGYYTREDGKPLIYIAVDTIKSIADRSKIVSYFKNTLAKVLIHEFAHARMDMNGENSKGGVNTWIEEAMANLWTLETLERASKTDKKFKTLFEFTKDFIKKQPENYAFWLKLYDMGIVFDERWQNSKAKIDEPFFFAVTDF